MGRLGIPAPLGRGGCQRTIAEDGLQDVAQKIAVEGDFFDFVEGSALDAVDPAVEDGMAIAEIPLKVSRGRPLDPKG